MRYSCVPRAALALMTVVFSGRQAAAQLCNGNAPFTTGPIQVGAGADFTDGAKGFGAHVGYGAPRGAYGNLELSTIDYNGTNAGGTVVGVSGGYSIPVSNSSKAEFCPMVGLSHQSGPNGGGVDLSTRTLGLGGAIGGVASSSPTLDFVPFASLAAVMLNSTATFTGVSNSTSNNYFELGVGAGFVMNKSLTIQPRVTIPMGLNGANPSYGIAFALNFGGAQPAAAPPPRRR